MSRPRRVARIVACSASLLALSACGGVTPSPPPSPPATAPVGTSAADVPAVDTARSTPASPQLVGAPAAPATPSPFVAVAELPYEMRLFALEGGLIGLGTSFDPDAPVQGMPMGVFDGDRFVPKPSMNFPSFWGSIVDIRGTWPGGVDAVAIGTTGRVGIAEHWVLSTEGKWVSRRSRTGSLPAGIAEVDGARITLEFPAMFPTHAPEWRSLRGPKLVRTLQPIGPDCRAKMKELGFTAPFAPSTAVAPSALGATRAGTLLVLGSNPCEEEMLLERWAPRATTSTVETLPSSGVRRLYVDPKIVTGSGPDEAWIAHGQVLRYSNGELQALPPLPLGQAFAATPGGEGVLYAAGATYDDNHYGKQTEQRLFRYEASTSAWTSIDLGGAKVTSLATDAQGTVWISAGTTLLRTRRSEAETSIALAPGAAPAAAQAKAGARQRPLLKPAGPLCPTNVVVLYGFTKVTPPDYDFPLTRKALKGRADFEGTRFVVAEDMGQKFFSAIVPDVATGRKLVALIEREVQGSKPQLLCASPQILRELPIDLRTGEVRK